MAPDLLRRHEDILRHVLVLKVLVLVLGLAAVLVGASNRMWWLAILASGCLFASILTEPTWLTKRGDDG